MLAGCSASTLFGAAILTAGYYQASSSGVDFPGGDSSQRVPDMASDRKVSEQDCSKPLDYSLGNIRCK